MDSYYVLWFIVYYFHHLVCLFKFSPQIPFILASISFWCVPIICLKYLTSGPQVVCSRPILCFCCPAMAWAIILRRPGSFSWRLVFRNQDLGSMCTYCCWIIIVSNCPQWRELEIYEHTHTPVSLYICLSTYIYIYIYIYIYVCIYIIYIYNKIITS